MVALRHWQDSVFAEMEAVSCNYLLQVQAAQSKMLDYAQHSMLRLQTHRRAASKGKDALDGNHLQAKWNKVKFFKHGGKTVKSMTSVRKSEGQDCYSMAQLKEFAQDWEWPLVEKTEKQLALLRRQASFIAQGITQLRYARMAESRYDEKYVFVEDDEQAEAKPATSSS